MIAHKPTEALRAVVGVMSIESPKHFIERLRIAKNILVCFYMLKQKLEGLVHESLDVKKNFSIDSLLYPKFCHFSDFSVLLRYEIYPNFQFKRTQRLSTAFSLRNGINVPSRKNNALKRLILHFF